MSANDQLRSQPADIPAELTRKRVLLRVDVMVMACILGAAVLAPLLAPYDPAQQLDIVGLKNGSPSWSHLLGTDPYSRDVLSRALFGARNSIVVAFVATAVATAIGTVWGLGAASAPKALGETLMTIVDVIRAIPRILLLLAVVALAGALPTAWLSLLLGVTASPSVARLVFAQVQQLFGREFVEAALSIGVSRWRLLSRHIAPHLSGPLTASGALMVADILALEAGLSFLGLGVRPPQASWGSMIQDALPFLGSAWWVAAVPCACLVITVLCAASIADRAHASRFGTR